ncbi:rRNA maturation RNase YbeY [Helicobacter canadensis]|uniref:Endoribonuclease YbeY n=1 Tax=Helicobacter canadensis MIT 98-5491 TaxID=537970 RepID=C5ZVM2_9HELI|nr:rRNA maturation RNase YbeY [Helicobacter canadensis]EES88989.1 conserved hypothetical protein [Helicobacter canadensis MIT 98-5491]EFR48696.1 translation metalloprotein YbeY [Helicobacter canadensis MIT 98-5491]STP00263.1 metal-binding heat shock protein [Helicobacter canadensis]
MHNKIDFDNQTDFKISDDLFLFLEKVFDKILLDLGLKNKQCELLLVDNPTIQNLNKIHRNKDKPTDVLSFPLESDFSPLLGSIVISLDFIKQNSEKYHHTPNDEMALLFIHGILHLLGFDHEKDRGEQRQKEKELIDFFHLPPSLIIRNQEC